MGSSVPVRCPACRRDHAYVPPVFPCACGAPLAPPLMRGAPPQPITHRTWTDSWVTVRCPSCGRQDQWPQPELGCGCGTVLRIPVRPAPTVPLPGPRPAPAGHADASDTGPVGYANADPVGYTDAPDAGPVWHADAQDAGPVGHADAPDAGPVGHADPPGADLGPGTYGGTAPARSENTGPSGGSRTGHPSADGQAGPAGSSARNPAGPSGGPGGPAGGATGGSRAGSAPTDGLRAGHLPADGRASYGSPARRPRPPFRPLTIRTARDAVTAAAVYLKWLGFRDILQSPEHPASGIDLRAPGLVAQVDPRTEPSTLRDVECLWLHGLNLSAVSVFFSLTGYVPEARARAENLGVPLFVIDLTGTPQPANGAADRLVGTGG